MKKNQKPLVSVIVPVYNGANYVDQAIESVLKQTYQHYELLVIDDGSQDNTSEVVQSYGSKLTYIRQENKGISAALNHGISKAKGQYFSWLSHDDLYFPEKLEKQISFFNEHPDYKLCNSDYISISPTGDFLKRVRIAPLKHIQALHVLFGKAFINGCCMMIDMQSFEEVGLFNLELKYCQDTEMWIRLLNKYELGHVQEPIVKQRLHPAQGTKLFGSLMELELLNMYRRLFDELDIARTIPSCVKEQDSSIKKSKGYEWLADKMATERAAYDFATELYAEASNYWPSWRNTARLKKTLGSRVCLGWRHFIYAKLSGLKRRI